MQLILLFRTLQHLFIVEAGKVGGTFCKASHDILRRIDIEGINILGDFRKLAPAFFPGIVGCNT